MTTRSHFLAIKPPPAVADEIGRLRDWVRTRPRSRDIALFHITIASLGEFFGRKDPTEHIDEAMRGFVAPQCRIVFDLLIGGHGTTFLKPSERLHGLVHLQSHIALRLRQHGSYPWSARQFSPHLTLFYDATFAGILPIDPISWTADEVILVESHQGQHTHRLFWPLVADTARAA